jgi:hypothetical protein
MDRLARRASIWWAARGSRVGARAGDQDMKGKIMRKTLLCFAVLLTLWAPVALAGGVNINWGASCWSDGTPLNDLSFACNTNTGRATLTCSFAVSQDQPQFVGIELDLEGATEATVVPAWWQMGQGDCRFGAVSTSADFLSAPQVGCVDMWQNLAVGGLAIYGWGPSWGGDNRTHILVVYALPAESPIPLTAGVEYYAAQVFISYQKTVGSGACAGCAIPHVWRFYSLKAAELTQYEMLNEPLPDGNWCVWWQNDHLLCYGGPTRNTTWGQVKSLYR